MSRTIPAILRELADAVEELLTPEAPAPSPVPTPPPPAPVPVPPAPPAPTPEPPTGPSLLTVTTNGHTLTDSSRPPVITDTIDLSRAMAPVPWSVFRDDQQHVAWSMRGAEPDHWRRLPIYGHPAEYSVTTPAVIDGKLQMLYPSSVNDADPNALIVPELKKFPVRGGPRGQAITTPYWLVRGHTRYSDGKLHADPSIPAWVAVDMVGRLYYLMRDGSVDLVAQIPLKTYANDFSYFEHDRKVLWVTDTAAGEILQVRREGRSFTSRVWAKVVGRATSVRAIGTKLYVANEVNVIELDALDPSVRPRVVCSLPGVFWVDYLSDGRLVVMTRNSAIHIVTPDGIIGPDINGRDSVTGADYRNSAPVGWVMVDVDRNGTCGPKDTIWACASHSQAINGPWRITPDKRITRIPGVAGGGRSLAGRSEKCIEGGHYQWVVAVHPDEAMLMIQGGSQILPLVYAAVGKTDASWPVEEPYDYALIGRGYTVMRQGGSLPGSNFAASMGCSGNSFVGCTPDHLAQMTFDDALAFVRRGLLSITPRPIHENDAHAVLAWLCRGSQRYLEEGGALMTSLSTWAKARNL